MTILYAAPALLVCVIGLSVWTEHKERMRKLDIEFKELEIELEEMRKDNE
jgi:hypothetical protein